MTLAQTAPGTWTSPDGYRVVRHTGDDGWVSWKVYRPGATKTGAVVAYLSEARDVIAAWRLTGGECAHLHLIHTKS